jgi:D-threo-aldose 1-dehydrogenase
LGYIDTAPFYGFGLSERRVGNGLRAHSGVTLSTKAGRLLRPDAAVGDDRARGGFRSNMPFAPVYDYCHDAIMRSYADSLQRLGLARIDILYVHDIGRLTHGDQDAVHFEALTKGGGLRALEALRASGAISAFGIGVNEIEACERVMDHADLDVILLAGRYTLLEQGGLATLFPRCAQAGTSIVIGGPYNSGILATGTRGGVLHYNYGDAPTPIVARVAALEAACDRFGVPLAAAALQFPLAHPQVASVIPGLCNFEQVRRAIDLYRAEIPAGY